jgi:hypothetical protein
MSSGWGGPPAYSAVISARRKRPPRLLGNSLELGIVAKAVPLNNRSVSHLLRALETSKALGIKVRFILRANGHFDSRREDGVHGLGSSGRA